MRVDLIEGMPFATPDEHGGWSGIPVSSGAIQTVRCVYRSCKCCLLG